MRSHLPGTSLSRLALLFLSLLAAADRPSPAATPAISRQGAAAIREMIRRGVEGAGSPPVFGIGDRPFMASELLPTFYEKRIFEPAWIGPDGPAPGVEALLDAVRASESDGLRPGDYHLPLIESLLHDIGAAPPARRNEVRARLDIVLTDSYLLLGTHLLAGRVDPATFDQEWVVAPREMDLARTLEEAVAQGRIRESLAGLLPSAPGYAGLKGALAAYRELAAAGGWAEIPAGPALRAGDRGPRVELLRQRLVRTGDLAADADVGAGREIFSPDVEVALRAFQLRHGLQADGVAGARTLEAMNIPAQSRVRQIELNLERWRWLPRELGSRYIVVNIPAFSLSVVEEQREALSMAVIVGRPYRRTPVFSDLMRYLVVNPSWEVPPSLAVQDVLPQVRKDPDYLAAHGFRVLKGWGAAETSVSPDSVDWKSVGPGRFPYRFRQDPGPTNSLGRIKFMFPNQFNVYLHDTPARNLFAGDERAFSSGCIRIERPVDLAEWLLRDAPGWSRAAIEKAVESGAEKTIPLRTPIPVHLEYWTAWAAPGGPVHFRKDIYGRDAGLDTALKAARADYLDSGLEGR